MAEKKTKTTKKTASGAAAEDERPEAVEELPPLSAELLEQIEDAHRRAEEAVADAVRGTAEQALSQ